MSSKSSSAGLPPAEMKGAAELVGLFARLPHQWTIHVLNTLVSRGSRGGF